MEQLAFIGAIASAVLAVVVLALALLGFRHLSRVPEEETVFAPTSQPAPST